MITYISFHLKIRIALSWYKSDERRYIFNLSLFSFFDKKKQRHLLHEVAT